MTPAPPSIRRRLSQSVLMMTLMWALLTSLAVGLAVQHEVDELLDDTLQASADVLAELIGELVVAGPTDTAGVVGAPATGAGDLADKHLAWQLIGPGGALLLRSPLAPVQVWASQPVKGFTEVARRWRIYGRPVGERMLYVAQTQAERKKALLEAGLVSAGVAVLVGALCALWLRARVRRELRPLADLSAAISHHDPLAPGATLPHPEREELLPIRDAIEALGRRLARRVANERAFSAHAAHALSTPLAGMDAQLAVALRERPPALRPRLLRTRAAAGRLGRVVTALLTLFRSGVDLQWQTVDVAALLARLPVEGLQWQISGGPTVQADPDLLAAALINLLDNALRHGGRQVMINIRPGPGGDGACISLRDDGQGITPVRFTELQDALQAQDYEGRMGLGLMMADMVARAHGGHVLLLPQTDGFTVELWLGKLPP